MPENREEIDQNHFEKSQQQHCQNEVMDSEHTVISRNDKSYESNEIDQQPHELEDLCDVNMIDGLMDNSFEHCSVDDPLEKSGITVVKNDDNELVPTRMQNGWRVCIDFRKLNSVIRKYQFHLPFIDS